MQKIVSLIEAQFDVISREVNSVQYILYIHLIFHQQLKFISCELGKKESGKEFV
jgi:hypothetical protein